MFLKFLKKKNGRKTEKKEGDLQQKHCDKQPSKETESVRSSPVEMPKRSLNQGLGLSRLGHYSSSRASSHLSVSSGSTEASLSSSSSRTLNTSVRSSSSSQWVYDIDRFKGAKNVPPKMRSMGYQDVWAQAFTFGGR